MKDLKRIKRLIFFLVCLYSHQAVAQVSLRSDSTNAVKARTVQTALTSMPLIAGGLIIKSEDDHFRSLRNDYMPEFHRTIDNYMQYTPLIVMLGLKLGGVEGRSSWREMIVADGLSALIMSGLTYSLKCTTRVMRPDGSNNHSFPSGHTATAFMAATMLTEEYGERSPWIGIGAYSVASATALMRIANNKHWLSDVMVGAGVGILSTEVGYLFSDIIFKIPSSRHYSEDTFSRIDSHPSFFGLYLGMNVPLSGYDIDGKNQFDTSSGSVAGVEGAYFFNPSVGLGGRFTASSTSIIVNNNEAADNNFDALITSIGPYFAYPLTSRWHVGTKVLGSFVHYPKLELNAMKIPRRSVFGFGTGLSVSYKARKHYSLRLFLDYNCQPSHSCQTKEWMNTLTFGTVFAARFH